MSYHHRFVRMSFTLGMLALCQQPSKAFVTKSASLSISKQRQVASPMTPLSAGSTTAAISSLAPLMEGKQGSTLSEDAVRKRLEGKRVALYFAAGWCPQCASLEPTLQTFRQACRDSGKDIELIYVPSDRSEEAGLKRAATMDMLVIPFGDQADEFKKSYNIWAGAESMKFGFGRRSGVPALVVLDKDGNEMSFLATESQGPRALGDWPLDDETGIW